MKTEILSLRLLNFKGVKALEVTFSENTSITGDNGTGKSTICDSFLWLLFGKDSSDRKDFEIKTLGPNNKVIDKLDHEVEAVLMVDGRKVTLKRCLVENWVKPRGKETAEFAGNTTNYFYNDVPLKAGEFSEKVDGIVKESMFKLLTSTTYFNSLPWEKRRAALMQLAGEIDDMEIIGNNKDFLSVISMMEEQKITMDQLKTSQSAKRKKAKDELDMIPARVDETTRATPEEPNYSEVNKEILRLQGEIDGVDAQINDAGKLSEVAMQAKQKKLAKINELKTELQGIEHAERTKLNEQKFERDNAGSEARNQIKQNENTIGLLENQIRTNQLRKDTIDSKTKELREKYNVEDAKTLTFDESKFECPTCKRAYEENAIEASKDIMTANFNNSKIATLESIQKEGKELVAQAENYEQMITDDSARLETLKTELEDLKKLITMPAEDQPAIPTLDEILTTHERYQHVKSEIETLNQAPEEQTKDTSELKEGKSELIRQLDSEKAKLSIQEVIKRNKARVQELKDREKELAQEISNCEKIELAIFYFNKAKSDIITQRVNSMFTYVQFKLFNTLINGNEEPCCDTLVNGVPYPDVNTGGKINAGLEIIRVLSDKYETFVPCFVDNAETISYPIQLQSQMILLTKVKDQKELIVK